MKALNREEVLVNAKANGTLDSFKPLTRDEAFIKKALGLGGGASSWNDLTDKPFHSKITNYPFTVLHDNGDGEQGHSWELKIDNFNVKSTYTVEIRGDVYSNLAPHVVSDNYVNYVWGDMDEFLFYPFRMMTARGAGKNDTFWNEDGFFVGGSGVYDYGIAFYVDTTKYPDLDIATEVNIYHEEINTIAPKFLPKGVVWFEETENGLTASMSPNEIRQLMFDGVYVYGMFDTGVYHITVFSVGDNNEWEVAFTRGDAYNGKSIIWLYKDRCEMSYLPSLDV